MKLPRGLSGQRVVKGLRRLGFQVENQEGSHVRLSNGVRRVTIPMHRELLPKTLQSILKQAGITIHQLREVI